MAAGSTIGPAAFRVAGNRVTIEARRQPQTARRTLAAVQVDEDEDVSAMARGFAVAGYYESGAWHCVPLPPSVLEELTVLLSALRSQPPENGPFVIAAVADEFFVMARQAGAHTNLMLSDLTASVEFRLAAQVLTRLGEDPPSEDELDDIWPLGDLDLLEDLGLSEDDMEAILDDLDAFPDEMLEEIAARIGITDTFAAASALARVAP